MIYKILEWLNRRYPQNYIITKPFIGSLIIILFCLTFILLYKPLNSHPGKSLSYVQTMITYCASMAIPTISFAWLIKKIKFFSEKEKWTILKELISIIIILIGIGTTVFLLAFLVEEKAERWNLETYLDSCLNSFMVCFMPFAYFTVRNYIYSLAKGELNKESNKYEAQTENLGKSLNIDSKLKKERLSFYSEQFLYAISDGNYVNFYLNDTNQLKKETIRNSISNIEEQLSEIPYLIRTHRAFIVNIKKVKGKKGNSLGYKLIVQGIDIEIPVSRKKVKIFDKLFNEYN